jgi:hypothetical protein
MKAITSRTIIRGELTTGKLFERLATQMGIIAVIKYKKDRLNTA